MLADRAQLRQAFFDAWGKFTRHEPLAGADALIIEAALRHPEYHPILASPDRYHEREWQPELGSVNPFLHLGLHIALKEQLDRDQPSGLRAQYEHLSAALGDRHLAEHRIIDCLAEALWQAQRQQTLPDEDAYLQCVTAITRSAKP